MPCILCARFTYTDKQSGEGESPSTKLVEASLSQLEIFQLILQKQCDAMVSLGVNPSIKVGMETNYVRARHELYLSMFI